MHVIGAAVWCSQIVEARRENCTSSSGNVSRREVLRPAVTMAVAGSALLLQRRSFAQPPDSFPVAHSRPPQANPAMYLRY